MRPCYSRKHPCYDIKRREYMHCRIDDIQSTLFDFICLALSGSLLLLLASQCCAPAAALLG